MSQLDRQNNRQAGRQNNRQTGRQNNRQTGRQNNRQTGSQNDRWNNRYKFIQDGLEYLYFNGSMNERDFFKSRAAIEEKETEVANDTLSDIRDRLSKYSNNYEPAFSNYDRISVEAAKSNEDYNKSIHHTPSYRFGKALQAFETSECPTTYQYTPIMYDDRDTYEWPWDENEKYEDPIVNPIGGNVYCCNKITTNLDPIYVDTKNNLFRRNYKDYPNCNNQKISDYKDQETRFVNYINEYKRLNFDIFEYIDLLAKEVNKKNLDTIFLVLQTYFDFFRDPLRLSFFDECVCRGNKGHAHIQKQIREIKQIVDNMLDGYGLTDKEQYKIIGENGILTNLDLYINKQNPNWKENTLLALRSWLSFNMRIEKRIKDEGKDEGKKVKLSEQPFYKIIKYVIQYLLKHLQNSTDAIPLLQLMPNMEKSEPNAPMSSFNDTYFDAVISYLLKETTSRTALLDLGSRLKLGLKCNAEEIFTVFIRIALRSQKIAKLLLRNLLRDYGNECKKDLENYLDNKIDDHVQQVFNSQPEEFRKNYKKNYSHDQKTKWKKQVYISYINENANVKYFWDVLNELN